MALNPINKTELGICPGCGARLRFQHKVELGEFVVCQECGDELEIIRLSPIKLDWAYADPYDDDWDGDDIDEKYTFDDYEDFDDYDDEDYDD